jgi:hypothetical protein
VQVQPEELVGLHEPGESIEVPALEHGERRAAGTHGVQTKAGSGGSGWNPWTIDLTTDQRVCERG